MACAYREGVRQVMPMKWQRERKFRAERRVSGRAATSFVRHWDATCTLVEASVASASAQISARRFGRLGRSPGPRGCTSPSRPLANQCFSMALVIGWDKNAARICTTRSDMKLKLAPRLATTGLDWL